MPTVVYTSNSLLKVRITGKECLFDLASDAPILFGRGGWGTLVKKMVSDGGGVVPQTTSGCYSQ